MNAGQILFGHTSYIKNNEGVGKTWSRTRRYFSKFYFTITMKKGHVDLDKKANHDTYTHAIGLSALTSR